MDAWELFVRRIAAHRGISTPADARAVGLSESTYHRRTGREGYDRLYFGVKRAPWASDDLETAVAAAVAACPPGSAAAGRTAAWLQGLDTPRVSFDVVVPSTRRIPDLGRHRAQRVTWLEAADVADIAAVPCLTVPATVISRRQEPAHRLRPYVIDAVHRKLVTLDEIRKRVARVPNVARLRQLTDMLDQLADRAPESIFHDLVLTDLESRGYQVDPRPRSIATPDGRGVTCDVAIPAFHVALEPEGDGWHNTRVQRRNDRRRTSQYAGTDWVPVPIDWSDWHDRPDWVYATIDSAILGQYSRGLGNLDDLPSHLRERARRG